MESGLDFRELTRRALAHDNNAREVLFTEILAMLGRMRFSRLPASDQDDAVQEAAVHLLLNLPRVDLSRTSSEIKSWFGKSGARRIMDYRTQRQRDRHRTGDYDFTVREAHIEPLVLRMDETTITPKVRRMLRHAAGRRGARLALLWANYARQYGCTIAQARERFEAAAREWVNGRDPRAAEIAATVERLKDSHSAG